LHTFASRLRRLAAACRVPIGIAIIVTALGASGAAADDGRITGTVIDQSGQPLPRAYVRLRSASGAESASTFTDENGHFTLPPAHGCEVSASLTGFEPATVACGSPPVRVVLRVAPVQETVVVSATRTEAPAGRIGASVTAFTADDLERRRAPLVAELLRTTPGSMVVRAGGLGTVTSLFVRGGESNDNKVLLDGIPLNEPGGTFNFSNLTTDNLERVEIVRGAQSALFGSDAMASVVQLVTKRPDRSDDRPHASLSFEGGTYGTMDGHAAVTGASRRLDYGFGVSRIATDNREPNNVFNNTTLSASVGVALGGSATMRFIGRGELEKVGTPGATAFGRPDLDAFFKRHDGVGGVVFDQQLGGRVRQRAMYSLSVSHQTSTNLTLDPAYTPQFGDHVAPFEFSDFAFDTFTSLHRHHASYQVDWRLSTGASRGDQLFTVLADWDGERAQLTDRLASDLTHAARDNVGVSIQHQASWRRIFVSAGARVERNASFGDAVVPRGSIVVVAHESSGALGETAIKASGGLGIKEPTVIQSFSPSPFFLGNPDLQPERARTVEAGIEQRLLGDRAKVELTWFDNRFRNIISTRTTDPSTFAAEFFNIGLTRARGVELGIEAAPTASLHARGGYTLVDSEILESTSPDSLVFQTGQWAFRRPRHSGYVGVTWAYRRASADLNGVFIGRYVDSDFASLDPPLVQNPGYATWDGRFSYRLSARIAGLLSIDNLADAEYMEPLGYPALRRAVRAGLKVTF
jgi:vitamin B12 transporter